MRRRFHNKYVERLKRIRASIYFQVISMEYNNLGIEDLKRSLPLKSSTSSFPSSTIFSNSSPGISSCILSVTESESNSNNTILDTEDGNENNDDKELPAFPGPRPSSPSNIFSNSSSGISSCASSATESESNSNNTSLDTEDNNDDKELPAFPGPSSSSTTIFSNSSSGVSSCASSATESENNSNNTSLDTEDDNEDKELTAFPGPGKILRNAQFGFYIVASKKLEPGEEILEENPLMISPKIDWDYHPNNPEENAVCVGCYKICAYDNICHKCGWPACSMVCENTFLHKNYECEIFSENGIRPKNLSYDYPALETLRCLLLREKDPMRFAKLLRHESHVSQRQNDPKQKECREYVINFIQNDCHLQDDFDVEIIEQVMGIISINSFCMINDYHRHASAIFHAISYVAHNCDSNTDVIWKFYPSSGSKYDQTWFSLKFFAAKTIQPGELLSHSYAFFKDWSKVIERQEYLACYWYFKCDCEKCRLDLFNEVLNVNEWDFNNSSIDGNVDANNAEVEEEEHKSMSMVPKNEKQEEGRDSGKEDSDIEENDNEVDFWGQLGVTHQID